MPYLLGFLLDNKSVLAIGNDNLFVGTDNPADAIKMLPNYLDDHQTDYTQSMSACIHWMIFSPRLFFFKDIDDIEQSLLDRKVYDGSSISGRIRYTHTKDDYKLNIAHIAKLII